MFDLIVTPSGGYRQRLLAGGLNKVRTVGLGVEPGRFGPHLRDEQLRRELLAGLGLDPSGYLARRPWPAVAREALEDGDPRRGEGFR